MIFKELILENFGPYQGRNIIDLTPDTEQNGASIILIGGMNGGGKTTIIDSIKLALYGRRAECSNRQSLSYNDFLLECVNRGSKITDVTKIELTFEHLINEQWIELKVIRHWQGSVRDGKDNLVIFEGEFPDLSLTENWDEYIEDILPLGISNLFLFDGEQVKELAEQDIPNPSVVDAMRVLLGLELADKLASDLQILVSRKKKSLENTKEQKELLNIEEELRLLEKDKSFILHDLQGVEKKLKIASKNYRLAADILRIEEKKVSDQQYQLKQKVDSLSIEIDRVRHNLNNVFSQYLPLSLVQHYLCSIKVQLIQEIRVNKIQSSYDIIRKKDQELLDFLATLSMDDINYQKINGFLESANERLEGEINDVNIYLHGQEKNLIDLENILDNFLPNQQAMAGEYVARLRALEEDLINAEVMAANVEVSKRYETLEEDYQQKQQGVIDCKAEVTRLQKMLESVERDIQSKLKQLGKYSDRTIEDLQGDHLLNAMPKVEKTLILFKEKLTLRKLNRLENEVTSCFRYLLHKSNFVGKVIINTDNFALNLYDNLGNLITKNRLSAGEKQLLAIALLWALARVSGRQLPVVIDTPLGRLDSSHRNNLLERYFPTASHQVILLSTDTEIGEAEVELLRQQNVIAKEYLLDYNSPQNQTTIKSGYFTDTLRQMGR
ncbi:DNA sulfur modification protein DndD [Cyanobacterium stanieri LEGE 03274]|uniref:Nuclease SbcCD subunit C n=1 Tax=Cyanobacterium stanieri LEGE 03274 TaxID=1828756 RepID=A0ABR9V5C3_9CHRO|nr:DNA sulfur modification protein DndD [Cyanobacterium stanieri]MBE9223057.1 DNA sulfur modification protein DndD [Cyanobacterium stanieri LEGE 03274]